MQDILNEYQQMRENGADSKTVLEALRQPIASLEKTQRAELAARVRDWENNRPAPAQRDTTESRRHAVIRPLGGSKTSENPVVSNLTPAPTHSTEKIICPNCNTPNLPNQTFCYACGQLLDPPQSSNKTKHFEDPATIADSAFFGAQSVMALRVRGSTDIYELHPQSADHELVIGRSTTGSAIMPDVDLISKQAADLGVSRMHLAVRFDPSQNAILVSDLGSANGSFLNGQRIFPQEVRVVRHGDELRLGKLVLMISFRHANKA